MIGRDFHRFHHQLAAAAPSQFGVAYNCVVDFVEQLKLHANVLIEKGWVGNDEHIENCVLKKALAEHEISIAKSTNNLALTCEAHLKFIHDILYDDYDVSLVTDPMYLFNRGNLANSYKFGIYQYVKSYDTFPTSLVKKTTAHDGNYILVPELKKLVNEFYNAINALSKTIDTTDENSPDYLIKKWAVDNDLDRVVSPPPPPPPQQTLNTPVLEVSQELENRRIAIYALCVIVGAIIGAGIGVGTYDSVGLSYDLIYEVDGELKNGGPEPTSGGWGYITGMMFGSSFLLCCLTALCRSKITFSQVWSDVTEALTPDEGTLRMFTSNYTMFSLDAHYLHQDSDHHDMQSSSAYNRW
ncbi:MAG: hypothetical protein ACHQAX_02820 [Gammaproteobacteria bacterium]